MRSWFILRGGESAPILSIDPLNRRTVVTLGLLILTPTAALRAWMLFPSWFYYDDFRLLREADGAPLNWSYLLAPYDQQFMPGGRAIAWVVAHSGEHPTAWGTAASITLLLWLLSGLACLWLLLELFGPRWGVLGLLLLHTTTALTAPATMWWAASLNQLPLLVVWYSSATVWVRYLRTRKIPWLVATVSFLGIGALFYVKTLLVLPVLVILLLGWFVDGGPLIRIRTAVLRYWPAAVLVGTAAAAFLWFYRTEVPQPFTANDPSPSLPRDLLTEMGGAFLSLAVGGPWQWAPDNPPVSLVDPPVVGIALALVVAVLLLIHSVLTRRSRALLVLLTSFGAAYLLLLTTRAAIIGPNLGREPRYLTEVTCALVLAIGLATMSVQTATSRRQPTRLGPRPGPAVAVVAVALVASSGAWSSIRYANVWHDNNPIDRFMHTMVGDASRAGSVAAADRELSADMAPAIQPFNRLRALSPLVTDRITFPETSTSLAVVDEDGSLHDAMVEVFSRGAVGPETDCGWKVTRDGQSIPLTPALGGEFEWWIRVPYLSSQASPVTVTAAGQTRESTLQQGLGSVWVHAEGQLDEIHIDGLSGDTVACVGEIEVGVLAPGKPIND